MPRQEVDVKAMEPSARRDTFPVGALPTGWRERTNPSPRLPSGVPSRFAVAVTVLALVALAVGAVGTMGVTDFDGDGVSSFDEYDAGTDPFAADSDGDGLDDGRERALGTHPLVADSDGDGLADGTEVDVYGTSATRVDTDGDDLSDDVEVADDLSNPLAADTDGDGLDDGMERDVYETDPRDRDTDGDGLDDGTEVEQYGTKPLATDSDGDGLRDATEVRTIGTDPTAGDTDGDGLGDGVEAASTGPLAAADPLHRDVFVELDYMRGERPSDDAIALVVDRFANAPLQNPDGSTGISLHVHVDDAIPSEPRTTPLDSVRLRITHFDNEGRGYHHALAVANAWSDGESVAGFAATGHLVLQTNDRDGDPYETRGQAHVLMHELGHSLGLSAARFAGIDSYDVPYDEYQSTMNYDAPWETVRYSTGGAFDDWAYIDANMYAPSALTLRLPLPANATANTTIPGLDSNASV
jgi:hypothetical protein